MYRAFQKRQLHHRGAVLANCQLVAILTDLTVTEREEQEAAGAFACYSVKHTKPLRRCTAKGGNYDRKTWYGVALCVPINFR